MTLAMSGATPGGLGLASGVVNTSMQVGGAIGLAVLATLAAERTDGREARRRRQPPGGAQLRLPPRLPDRRRSWSPSRLVVAVTVLRQPSPAAMAEMAAHEQGGGEQAEHEHAEPAYEAG